MIGQYIWKLLPQFEHYKDNKKLHREDNPFYLFSTVQSIIEISNVADYVQTLSSHNFNYQEDTICIIPPFKKTWFEFIIPNSLSYCGVYLYREEIPHNPNEIPYQPGFDKSYEVFKRKELTELINENYPKDKTYFSIGIIWFFENEEQDCIGNYSILCNEYGVPLNYKEGRLWNNYNPIVTNTDKKIILNNNTDYNTNKIDKEMSCVLIAALNFIHCKNIKLTEVNYNRKLVRHCKRTNKSYFEKYHVIDIERPKKILNTEGKAKEVGIKQAFHICRGHFKTYDKNNPLFGKLTGTYWWESYSRGDIKKGKISKDYKVKIK